MSISVAQSAPPLDTSPAYTTTTKVQPVSFNVAYSYPVVFTHQVFNPDNPVLCETLRRLEPNKRHRTLVLIDEGVATHNPLLAEQWLDYATHHSASICSAGTPIIIAGGEAAKNDVELQTKLSQYIELNAIDRHSFILAIGGGAMLDAVGLAAATAHRGVRLVRIPTTVLAQNDAGIGVKNGINRFGQKNWYGTFAPPFAVINDDHFLQTLGPVERRAGMAEAIKVALIRDASFFDWIEANTQALSRFDRTAVRHLIEHCATLHLRQIAAAGDPFEQGAARPLDFGHWAAHRLEKMTKHRMSHGDAVAIGIMLDSRYSHLAGLLGSNSLKRIVRVISALGFPMYDAALDHLDTKGSRQILTGLEEFQRHLGGNLTITLLKKIGVGIEVHALEVTLIEQALRDMQGR